MPNAMFFNWEREGACRRAWPSMPPASAEHRKAGQPRNSAGCIHLSPENAETLHDTNPAPIIAGRCRASPTTTATQHHAAIKGALMQGSRDGESADGRMDIAC